jgi:large subunit ribosomal protein L21
VPAFSTLMDYAIIRLGNKQHRVRDGETLVVDRLPTDEGASFEPVVLLGETKVTATVLAHGRGPKIVVGKYRRRTGYKRHNGFRAATSQVQIALGAGTAREAAARAAAPKAAGSRVTRPKAVEPKRETASKAAAAKAPAAPKQAAAAVLPEGYEGMTVAQIAAAAKEWGTPQLEAALAHERAGAARKGALAALESALARGGAG